MTHSHASLRCTPRFVPGGPSVSMRLIGSMVLIGLPVFFAGSFRRSRFPSVDFGANLAGIVSGGIAEYAALVVGYQAVVLLAIVFYLLSLVGRPRWTAPWVAS